MNVSVIILGTSIMVQAVSVLFAVRLMCRTKRYLAGMMIISVVLLMVFRRSISLYRCLGGDDFQIDTVAETVALIISFVFLLGILYAAKIIESELQTRREKEALIGKLSTALAEIKTLRGIIPICAACKRIRDDRGSWSIVEQYLREHSDAEFSHGICPECAARLYPDHARHTEIEDDAT